jgi:tryptophan synthase beta chain
MHTLVHTFVPPPIHSGGLRYHGMAPLFSALTDGGVISRRSYHQTETFEAAVTFARVEGMLCAPETSHCIKAGIDEALKCKETGEEKCIVITYSGHGFFDLASYEKYLAGDLSDYEHPDSEIRKSLDSVPRTGNQ